MPLREGSARENRGRRSRTGSTCFVIARLRRLLLVPAAALILIGAPALALDEPNLPRPTTTRVPLDAMIAAADAGTQWTAEADVDADLVGVTWTGDPNAEFRIEARYGDDEWRPASDLASDDLGADDATPDAKSAAAARHTDHPHATEPVWLGDADAVRVTIVGGTAESVTLEAVNAEQVTAPGGSAGALGVSLPGTPDRAGYAVALVLGGLALTAVA